jgi:hypothetical protein
MLGWQRKDRIMGKTIMGAVVSLDGFIADDNDDVGPRSSAFRLAGGLRERDNSSTVTHLDAR